MMAVSFDPVWEKKYSTGHQQRAPWDEVVSFVFRHAPKDRSRAEIEVLEVGCGTASNLWFFALEGFSVTGLDGSASAIESAKQRFREYDLEGDLQTGDFTTLPYEDGIFDLVIDRGALTCCGTQSMKQALSEVHRVTRQGGKFLFTPNADTHSSARAGRRAEDDLVIDISEGTLAGAGQIRFLSRSEMDDFLAAELWSLRSLELVDIRQMLEPAGLSHSQWRVVAEKKG